MKGSNAPSRQKKQRQQVLRKEKTPKEITIDLLEDSQDAASDIIVYHNRCKGTWDHDSENRLHKANQVVYNFNHCVSCSDSFTSKTQTRYICNKCRQCFCVECASDFYLATNVQNKHFSTVLGTDLLNQNSLLSSVKATPTTVCIGISYIDFLAYFY